MTYEQMHEVAQYLYQLLDDIDTAGDVAKGDDKLYRAIVERTQSKKAQVVEMCDGYTVKFKSVPNVEFRPTRVALCARSSLERRVRTLEANMQLVLIRGLPGSGKSTMARAMTTHEHYEADMFFVDESGAYHYDREKIKAAHEWCQRETFKALANGKCVVVSNTFTRFFEMEPYFDMAKTFGIEPNILEATGHWPNVHGVPAEVIEKMRQRWETSSNVEFSGGAPLHGAASAGLPG